MVKSVDGAGSVSPHSAAAQPDSAERSRSRSNSSGAVGAPDRGLDARKAIPAPIMDCRAMTAGQIQALIDEPDERIGGFNFEGNQYLTLEQFYQIAGTPLRFTGPEPLYTIFPNLKFAQLKIKDTNLGKQLIKASEKWALMEELCPIFMPEENTAHQVNYPTQIDIEKANKEAFMQALRDHPLEAKKIEMLALYVELTNAEFAEIVSYLENVTDLDVPDTVTEIPDLTHLAHLKHLNGENEEMLRAAAPEGCRVNQYDSNF